MIQKATDEIFEKLIQDDFVSKYSIPVNVTEDEKMLGYSYATLEKPVKVEKGEKVLIYARLAGDIVQGYPLNEIAEKPEEYLDEMECCILIYLTFE